MANKVHPSAGVATTEPAAATAAAATGREEPPPAVLTVWRKSLLFNCDGFTVYDAKGDLAFRVDCYGGSGSRADDVVLMDVAGKPLLTVRRVRRRLGLSQRRWVIYDGDAAGQEPKPRGSGNGNGNGGARPLLSVRRHVAAGLLGHGASGSRKTLASVTPLAPAAAQDASYVVEGSYGHRACAVRDARGGAVVAEVQRKEAVGDDVFRLVVAEPRLGAPLAMALVIALDEMFRGGWSPRSLLRRTWSSSY